MPEDRPDHVARSLIADLASGGELVDDGEFSLDAAQALAKLRERQLADAHAWVLRVVEAAVLSGAAPAAIELDRGDLVVELGALVLDRHELEQLFTHVLSEPRAGDPLERRTRHRAIQQLALAAVALLRLEARSMILESVDDAGAGHRLTITPEHALGQVEAIAGAKPGTRVRVDRRGGFDEERALVDRQCRLSATEIDFCGERIGVGIRTALFHLVGDPSELRGCGTVDIVDESGYAIGLAGMCKQPVQGMLTLVCNGVLLEQRLVDETGFVAVVDLDLPKDLGQTHARESPQLDALLAQVERARQELVARLEGQAKRAKPRRALKRRAPMGETHVPMLPTESAKITASIVAGAVGGALAIPFGGTAVLLAGMVVGVAAFFYVHKYEL